VTPERLPARHDRDAMHRIGAGTIQAEDRVTAFVIGDALRDRRGSTGWDARGRGTIFSSASMKSWLRTFSCRGGREQRGFVYQILEIRARKPGVARGELRRSTSPANGTSRVCHAQDRLAAELVRRLTTTRPVEATRPQQRLVEHVRLVGRRHHDDALAAGEAVHFREDLVERLLLLARPAERDRAARRPIASSSSMKMIAGACSRACLKRSRTRAAPTPTIISTNSAALIEKNGTSGLARDGARSSVLPVPGAPISSTPFGACAEARVLRRVLQELDDLDQLVLRLVDAGDVVERDLAAALLS
jgi:hypothetical protein